MRAHSNNSQLGDSGQSLRIIYTPVADLKPFRKNARSHSAAQIAQIARSIRSFGFVNPVLIDENSEIIAGHGRLIAAIKSGLDCIPTIVLPHLNDIQKRALRLADNKIALNAGWDIEILAGELETLFSFSSEFDVTETGFSITEVDAVLDAATESKITTTVGPEDEIPKPEINNVCRTGDVWHLGRHSLIVGDARNAEDYERLLDGKLADLIFADPPYNVAIDGHACGAGRIHHRDFAMGVGEMSQEAFTDFLTQTLRHAAATCRDGAIAYVCMDWRHMVEIVTAGQRVFSELKNVCVWNKTNGGQGSFYRSKHELVFVFKVGTAPCVNNFGLGETGRYRTNVWDYPGVNSIGAERMQQLAMHPTVKPVALVADAIRDCSKRGDIVLDCFAGSGTTLIAAEKCGRVARLIEYDPVYCDTIVRRYERYTGKQARHYASGALFGELTRQAAEEEAKI